MTLNVFGSQSLIGIPISKMRTCAFRAENERDNGDNLRFAIVW